MNINTVTPTGTGERFQKSLNLERMRQSWVYEQFRDVVEEYADGDKRVSETLDFIEAKHEATYRHGLRVGMLGASLAASNPDKIPRSLATELTVGGALHDTGKSCNDHIMHLIDQPVDLVDGERSHVSAHAELGYDYLSSYSVDVDEHDHSMNEEDLISGVSAKIARYHHSSPDRVDDPNMTDEDWDKVLMTKISDVVDALCDPERTYRTQREKVESADDAYEIVKKVLPAGKNEIFGLDVEYIVHYYWDLLQKWHKET